ncbi:F-type H+-transporting ATPase subunith [Rhodotorula toruloides]|uniref:F-type H+-transporting ATPase subunith n=1 Tax=Rhodotorula toruloides TaxID=5286 RepID=A0A511KM79_RHOTO|nr:F-type H+-transporting ATPase subunith [Rhodotorula toruloides]
MFARRVVHAARPLVARPFSATSAPSKDLIQDLYLRELRSYKPKPAASAQGATKSYSTPSAPKAPEVPDAKALASELAAYEASSPDVATTAPGVAAEATEDDATLGADDFLKLCEQDVKVEAKH